MKRSNKEKIENVKKIEQIKELKDISKDWILIAIGAFFIALATNLFFEPYDLVTGGISGIGIIIKHYTDIPLWLTTIIINIPLFIIMFWIKGKNTGVRSIYGMLMLSLAMFLTENLEIELREKILVCIVGGALTGVGCGLVFSGLGTTGGSDIIAIIMQHFIPKFTVIIHLRIIETIIVLLGTAVYGIENTIYAIVAIFISTYVSGTIMEGLKYGNAVYIISERYEEITSEIIKKLERGVTLIDAKGMYTGDKKNILVCIIRKRELPNVKAIINTLDKNAFVYITDAKEVFGNGFYIKNLNDI